MEFKNRTFGDNSTRAAKRLERLEKRKTLLEEKIAKLKGELAEPVVVAT
jgi:hypothetical protein